MELIRKAVPDDAGIITELLTQVEHVHHELRPDIFRGPGPHVKYERKELEAIFEDENRPIFVIERDGTVRGYAFCIIKKASGDPVLNDAVTLYVDDLCVDENCRRLGYGKKLFDFVSGYARGLGCHSVTLNVWSGNEAAMRFYESVGMTPRNITMEKILEPSD